MSDLNYFLLFENWSLSWLIGLVGLGVMYSFFCKAKSWKKGLFYLALGLIYIVFGSPVSRLAELGLHSVTMFQQMLVLMVIPILLLKSLPPEIFKGKWPDWVKAIGRSSYFIPLTWVVGALAMWSGHFLTAGILSSKMGIAICGVAVSPENWISVIPVNLIFIPQLFAGLFFALPVFHPNASMRLGPLNSVIYLFTACVSCSALGLYVAFTASSSAAQEVVPLYTIYQNPFPVTLRTDQEFSGLLMWVPGCIIYVASCMDILLNWYQDGSVTEPQVNTVRQISGVKDSVLIYTEKKPIEL